MRRGAIDFTLQSGANEISATGTTADKGKTDKYSFFIGTTKKKEDLSRLLVTPFSSVDKSLTL